MRWLLILCLFICYCDQQNDINKIKESDNSQTIDINKVQYDVDMMDTQLKNIHNKSQFNPITETLNND